MYIKSYPDCCAFKIAYDFYNLDDNFFTTEEINSRIKKLVNLTSLDTRSYMVGSKNYNNHVLIAINHNQPYVVKHIRNYIKENNLYNVKIRKLTAFINPKSKNEVELYMLYNTQVHEYSNRNV